MNTKKESFAGYTRIYGELVFLVKYRNTVLVKNVVENGGGIKAGKDIGVSRCNTGEGDVFNFKIGRSLAYFRMKKIQWNREMKRIKKNLGMANKFIVFHEGYKISKLSNPSKVRKERTKKTAVGSDSVQEIGSNV